ncbi:hypothetical protein KI387_041217, partial [Taxus chinensis]
MRESAVTSWLRKSTGTASNTAQNHSPRVSKSGLGLPYSSDSSSDSQSSRSSPRREKGVVLKDNVLKDEILSKGLGFGVFMAHFRRFRHFPYYRPALSPCRMMMISAMAMTVKMTVKGRKATGASGFFDLYSLGYSADRLGKLIMTDAMHVVSEVEELYEGMISQMELLAKQVAESSQALAKRL